MCVLVCVCVCVCVKTMLHSAVEQMNLLVYKLQKLYQCHMMYPSVIHYYLHVHSWNINDYKTGNGPKPNSETLSRNHYCSGTGIIISYSESFVCSLRKTTCNIPALYCHPFCALLYCIFSYYLLYLRIF
jgi:hypothetical protein